MLKVQYNMSERRNFLLLAVGMGVIGTIIGVVTILNSASELLTP